MNDNWFQDHGTLNEKQKKILYNELQKFDEYGEAVYQKQDLNVIAKKFAAITEYAKAYLNENGDSFDRVTINRNIKEIEKKVRKFKKEAKKVQQHRNRLTALYDDIGMKFSRYFEVGGASDLGGRDEEEKLDESAKPKNDMKLRESDLRGIIREELQKLTEVDARQLRRIKKDVEMLGIGGGTLDHGSKGMNKSYIELANGKTVILRQVLSGNVKVIYGGREKTVRDRNNNVAQAIKQITST